MDAGASVITVISLALTSTYHILKTASKIHDAPENIKQISTTISALSALLQQLTDYNHELQDANDLSELVQKCSNDLVELSAKLNKASPSGTGRARSLQRSFKFVLHNRAWDSRLNLIRQHYHALSLQLSILEGYNVNQTQHSFF